MITFFMLQTGSAGAHPKYAQKPAELSFPNLRTLIGAPVIDREQRSSFQRGSLEIDAFVELGFDTLDELQAGISGRALTGLTAIKKVDKAISPDFAGRDLIKRVSLLRRKDTVSPDEFMGEWWGLHSELVREMPGYIGYNQNLVLDRMLAGNNASHHQLPVDGIVEFWFPDMAGFDECYASDAFKETAAHGAEFIQEITTFLVKDNKPHLCA